MKMNLELPVINDQLITTFYITFTNLLKGVKYLNNTKNNHQWSNLIHQLPTTQKQSHQNEVF